MFESSNSKSIFTDADESREAVRNLKNDLEMITELIMQYMENANLCLMYVNDKLMSEEKQRRTVSRGR